MLDPGALSALLVEHLLGWLDQLRQVYSRNNSNVQVNE